MKTQYQLYADGREQLNDINTVFLEMVSDPVAPLTGTELRRLINKRPDLWGRFSHWIPKLDNVAL